MKKRITVKSDETKKRSIWKKAQAQATEARIQRFESCSSISRRMVLCVYKNKDVAEMITAVCSWFTAARWVQGGKPSARVWQRILKGKQRRKNIATNGQVQSRNSMAKQSNEAETVESKYASSHRLEKDVCPRQGAEKKSGGLSELWQVGQGVQEKNPRPWEEEQFRLTREVQCRSQGKM